MSFPLPVFCPGGRKPPTVVDRTPSINNTSNTSRNVTLPAGIVAGDLLLLAMACQRADTLLNTPAGWTQVINTIAGSGGDGNTLAVFRKIAAGTEGTSLTVTSTDQGRCANLVWRIRDFDPVLAPAALGAAGAASNQIDPPSLSPSFNGMSLVLALASSSPPHNLSSYPIGYSNGWTSVTTNSGVTNTSEARVSGAELLTEAFPVDPGVFTLSGNAARLVAATVIIPGL